MDLQAVKKPSEFTKRRTSLGSWSWSAKLCGHFLGPAHGACDLARFKLRGVEAGTDASMCLSQVKDCELGDMGIPQLGLNWIK